MLKCENLSVQIDNHKILNGFNLEVKTGEVHGILGPNGIGKSTICKTVMGYPNYEIVEGNIIFNEESIKEMDITERARLGIYLVNQSPIEIPGVTNAEMLRMALSERTGKYVSLFEFNQKMENICEKLAIPLSFIHRGINEGMSGGERKKNELLHLWMLEPSLIILDELDSGLDVDSNKIICASINEYRKTYNASVLIITHQQDLLKRLKADYVHILSDGKIIKTGDLSLALEIAKEGFNKYHKANKVSESDSNE